MGGFRPAPWLILAIPEPAQAGFGTSPDADPLLYFVRSPYLSAASWSRISNTTTKAGANRQLNVPLQRPAGFFRLRRD